MSRSGDNENMGRRATTSPRLFLLKRDDRGEAPILLGLVLVGAIVFIVGTSLTSTVSTSAQQAADNARYALGTDANYATANPGFDNTASIPTGWENAKQSVTTGAYTVWNSADYARVLRTDNSEFDNMENVWWYNAARVTMPASGTITSATLSFSYMIVYNENLRKAWVNAYLDNGTGDNTLIYREDVTSKSTLTWYAVENVITSRVVNGGSYRIIVEVQLEAMAGENGHVGPAGTGGRSLTEIDIDGAGFSANVHTDSDTAGAGLIELSGGTLWGLVILGIMAIFLLKMFGYLG